MICFCPGACYVQGTAGIKSRHDRYRVKNRESFWAVYVRLKSKPHHSIHYLRDLSLLKIRFLLVMSEDAEKIRELENK